MTSIAYAPLELPPAYRRYIKLEGDIQYGSSNGINIDRDGLLLGLVMRFVGTVTAGATAPVAISGNNSPHNILANVNFLAGGNGNTVSIPGDLLDEFYRNEVRNNTDDVTFPVPAADATVDVEFGWYIPIAVRDPEYLMGGPGDLVGAIYTGDGGLTCKLSVTWNTGAVWYSNFAAAAPTIAGQINVYSHKLAVPQPQNDPMLLAAISWYHAIQMDTDSAIPSVGNIVYQPSVGQTRTYLRWFEFWQNNGLFTAAMLSTLDVKVQGITEWFSNLPEDVLLAQQKAVNGGTMDPGCYVIDLSASKTRDQWIDVTNVTEIRLTAQMTAGQALTNATFRTVAEYVQPSSLAQKWIAKASAAVQKEAAAA